MKVTSNYDYTVIVPVFNGENSIYSLVDRISRLFYSLKYKFEIILIDDHSSDNSWATIKKIYEENPGIVKAFKLTKNYGQHASTLFGFTLAAGRFVITIDDDLQIPPEEIGKLILKQIETQANIVYGLYEEKGRFLIKFGKVILIKLVAFFYYKDIKWSSFRLIDGNVIFDILNHQKHVPLVDEFIFRNIMLSFQHVIRVERDSGKSGYSLRKLIRITFGWLVNYTIIIQVILNVFFVFFCIASVLLVCVILMNTYLKNEMNYYFIFLIIIFVSQMGFLLIIKYYLKMISKKKFKFPIAIEICK